MQGKDSNSEHKHSFNDILYSRLHPTGNNNPIKNNQTNINIAPIQQSNTATTSSSSFKQ